MWIIAGPNGAGKSSLLENTEIEDFGRSIWIINPDILASRIGEIEGLQPDAANLEAVRRIEAWLHSSIRAHQTVGVETVLSTGKYRSLVTDAKRLGFEIRLIYVLLYSVHHHIERVRIRVAKGGHAVPADKIRKRYKLSLEQLPWFLRQADIAWLFDNSGATPRLIGRKQDGVIVLDPEALPEIAVAAEKSAAS